MNVLVVDDIAAHRKLLSAQLEAENHRTFEVGDGVEALQLLAREEVDAVVSDILMPEMDGFRLCHEVRKDERFNALPFVLYTSAYDSVEDEHLAQNVGADRYIRKPAPVVHILDAIAEALRKNGKRTFQPEAQPEEFAVLKQYNAALVRKLKKKTAELQVAMEKLERVHTRILEINADLESRVRERTAELEASNGRLLHKQEIIQNFYHTMEADLGMARELQVAFLPRKYPTFPPSVPVERSAIHFCHSYSSRDELGGDFFDIFKVSDTQAGVMVCDVMGHGVRSALVTAIVRGLLAELRPIAHDPGALLTALNSSLAAILRQALTTLFVSGFYVVVDAASGTIRYANAGHPFPVHVRRHQNSAEYLNGYKPGVAMGLSQDFVYSTCEGQLAEHDAMLLFTDGLYKVEGANCIYYTRKQLLEAVRRRIHLRPPEILNEVFAEISAFSAKKKFEDDVCLVGVEFAGRESTRLLPSATPEALTISEAAG